MGGGRDALEGGMSVVCLTLDARYMRLFGRRRIERACLLSAISYLSLKLITARLSRPASAGLEKAGVLPRARGTDV
jgi:hypothetical protein